VFQIDFVRGLCKLFVEVQYRAVEVYLVEVYLIEVYPIVVYLIGKGVVEVWSIPLLTMANF
jgi:hypothetical protein